MNSTHLSGFLGVALMFLVSQSWPHEGHDDAFGKLKGSAKTVIVTLEGQAAIGLQVETARRGTINNSLKLPGRVEAAEDLVYDINPPVSGVVREVKVKLGDAVKAGTPLAVIHSIEVADALGRLLESRAQIKAEIAVKRQEMSLARSTYEREKMLWEEGIAPKKDYEAASTAYNVAATTVGALESRLSLATQAARSAVRVMGLPDETFDRVIKTNQVVAELPFVSPVAGIVTFRDFTPGEAFDTGKKAFTILDFSQVWVTVDVFQDQIPKIAIGQQVGIITSAGDERSGTISSIGSVVDAAKRTLPVRIVTDNPEQGLRPGMFVTGEIMLSASREDVLIVPAGALIEEGGRTIVFVKLAGNSFRPVDIKVGTRNSDTVEVAGGIAEGDSIVVAGARQLYSQSLLAGRASDGHEHAAEPHEHAAEPHEHGTEPHEHGTEPHEHAAEPHEHGTADGACRSQMATRLSPAQIIGGLGAVLLVGIGLGVAIASRFVRR